MKTPICFAVACLLFLSVCYGNTPAWDVFAPLDGVKTRCSVPVKDNAFRLIRAKRKSVLIYPARKDFSSFNAVSFEIEANGKADSDEEMGVLLCYGGIPRVNSYFLGRIPVSFSGKKKMVLLFSQMGQTRDPKLNPITRIEFITAGWGLKVGKDFAATIRDVRMLKLSPEEMKKLDPDKPPVVNFRKMVYPNLCGVTEADVKRMADCLPDRPCLPGGDIHDREFWARYPVCDYLVKRAESRLSKPPPRYTWEDYDQKKPWPMGSHLQHDVELERYLASMTVLECKENKGRFIPRITETIEAYLDKACPVGHTHWKPEMKHWIRKKGFRYLELGNVVRMSDIAVTCRLLDDKLPAGLRKRVRAFMDEWMFSPMFLNLAQKNASDVARLNYGTWAMGWINGHNNWNPFCSRYVMVCVLAMLEPKQERAYLLASLVKSIGHYPGSLTSSGYITEGTDYWMMGFGAYLNCARLLKDVSHGRIDLLAGSDPKIRRSTYIARDMMMAPGGLYPHFADYGLEGKARAFWDKDLDLMNQAFGENIYPVPPDYNPVTGVVLCGDYFATLLQMNRKKDLKTPDPEKPYFWDPEAQVLVARDKPKADNPFSFAFKGGHNRELHNHNDVGSFVVGLGKSIQLGDPGVGVYNVGWNVSASRSRIHPVPLPNNVEQGEGPAYRGTVLAVENDDRHSMVHLDFKAAYFPGADLKKLDRKVVYDREKRVVTIIDSCELNQPGTYELPLPSFEEFKEVSPGVWTAGGLRIEIRGTGGELEFQLRKPQVKLRTRKIFTMLICKFKGKVKSCSMTVTITPQGI